jgi:hypothetical protein
MNIVSARTYLALGWALLPCSPKTKAPLTPHGFKDASLDEAQIQHWLTEHPGCAWGCPTSSERAVIDIDPRNGGDNTWKALLAEHGDFPETVKVRTGGGGWHVYCRMPTGTRSGVLADGIDLKAEGGYVVVPPSRINIPEHEGRAYVWEAKAWEVEITEAPAWVVALSRGAVRSATRRDAPINPFVVQADADDLLIHPGSPEGERRKTLCRLVGVHLSRGDSEATVRGMAAVWADRCQPPFDEWEKHVTGLSNKQAVKASASPTTITPSLAPADCPGRKESSVSSHEDDILGGDDGGRKECPPTEPEDTFLPASAEAEPDCDDNPVSSTSDTPNLHPDAYHGLLGEMLRAVEPETEAHPAGILLSWLACFGNVVGRGAWFAVGPRIHHPALFVGIVGRTSDAKGDSWAASVWSFRNVEPDWAQRCVANGIGSGEGLIERIADEQRFMTVNRQGVAEETVIPGAGDKRCLVRLSELSRCFKLNRRENATLSEHLREAWDGDPIHVPNRKANALGSSGYGISLVGDITPGALQKTLATGTEAFDGFANRFLWVKVKSPRSIPDPANMAALEPFLPRLASVLALAREAGELKRDAEAKALWDGVYPALKSSGDGVPHTDRARPYVVRLSMLYALVDGSAVIRVEHLKAALAVWDYCRESARMLFTGDQPDNPDPLWLEVLNAIDAKPGVLRSKLTEQFKRKANAEQLKEVLSWLLKQGKAHPTVENTGGRKAERWWSGRPADNPDPSENGKVDGALPVPGRKESKGRVEGFLGGAATVRKVSPGVDSGPGEDTFLPGEPSERREERAAEVVSLKTKVKISERPVAPDLADGETSRLVQEVLLTGKGKVVDDGGWGWERRGERFVSFRQDTDYLGEVRKLDEVRHQTQADAERRVNREAERHRQWLARYHAAQAERIAVERERTGADEPKVSDAEADAMFTRLKAKPDPTQQTHEEVNQAFWDRLLAP